MDNENVLDNESIMKYMEAHKASIISDLAGFIEIPSVSDDKENVNKALDYALNLGEKLGFNGKSVLNHQVGVIEIGTGEETIGILSHVDVVEPANMSLWETPPFTLVVEDGKLKGRGTMDDKGAIIVCLYAMKAVVDLGLPIYKKIQLILGTQEEVEWVDMDGYVKEYELPDYGFTPDGEFPLCNIEKGGIDIMLNLPLNNDENKEGEYLEYFDAGKACNAVPGTCKAIISRYKNNGLVSARKLKTYGKGVHSCQPEKGENAIFLMADKLKDESLVENQLMRIVNMIDSKFRSIYGKEIGLYSPSETYNGEYVHRNVFSPTVFKVKNNMAHINVNIRFSYGTNENDILKVFDKIAKEYGGYTSDVCVLPAVYVSKDRPFMKIFADAYEEATGRKNDFVLAYGGSYAKAMKNIVSWGPIFPDDVDTCHEDNEYITEKSLMDNGKIFALALCKLALSKESYK